MERSAIKVLNRRGLSHVAIAEALGCHRTTVAAAVTGPVEVSHTRERSSATDPYRPQIETWLARQVPVRRMLELVREGEPPYTGSQSAFYARVVQIREAVQRRTAGAVVRFEGLPGEFLQVDWGEVRKMGFSHPALAGATRYFLAARLKYSRFMVVQFFRGSSAADVAQHVRQFAGVRAPRYASPQAAYDVKKLRGHHLMRRVGRTRWYELVPNALKTLAAAVVLRIHPLLAATEDGLPSRAAQNPTPLDHRYETLRFGMRTLFQDLGLAA